jgi:hypothetical protein
MAEKENHLETIQPNPSEIVSSINKTTPGALVQALVADQSTFSALSQAILAAIKEDLPSHEIARSQLEKVAVPVGQSTKNSTEESVDQTVRANKRPLPIDVIVVDESNQAKRARSDSYTSDEQESRISPDEEGDFEGVLSPNSRWEASEELDALLNVILKPLQRFERRTIIKEFPRPASEAAFTPSLDTYLTSMISGVKNPDNSLKDTQDKILDILGPLCKMYENINVN